MLLLLCCPCTVPTRSSRRAGSRLLAGLTGCSVDGQALHLLQHHLQLLLSGAQLLGVLQQATTQGRREEWSAVGVVSTGRGNAGAQQAQLASTTSATDPTASHRHPATHLERRCPRLLQQRDAAARRDGLRLGGGSIILSLIQQVCQGRGALQLGGKRVGLPLRLVQRPLQVALLVGQRLDVLQVVAGGQGQTEVRREARARSCRKKAAV